VVASEVVGSYSCILTDDTLDKNQESLLDYVNKLGADVATDVAWKGATTSRKADVANIVSMSYQGGVAETIFSVFSMCAATQAARTAAGGEVTPVPSQPLVLLRSTRALQKELISTLYG
jgi:hypothetical protein